MAKVSDYFEIFIAALTMQVGSNRPRDPLHTDLLASRTHRTLLQFRFAVGCPPCTVDRQAQRGRVDVAAGRLW